MTYLIPPAPRSSVLPSDLICKQAPSDQTYQNYSVPFPMLSTSVGTSVALRYQENGHVSLSLPPGKLDSGMIYIYGTTTSHPGDTLISVHRQWTWNGAVDDQEGILLGVSPFDDGECYQAPQPTNTAVYDQ